MIFTFNVTRVSQNWDLHGQQEGENAEGVGCRGQTPPGPDQVAQSSKQGDAESKTQAGQRPCRGSDPSRQSARKDTHLDQVPSLDSYPSWPSRIYPRTPAPGRSRPPRCLRSSAQPADERRRTPHSWGPGRSRNQRPPPGGDLQEETLLSGCFAPICQHLHLTSHLTGRPASCRPCQTAVQRRRSPPEARRRRANLPGSPCKPAA